MRASLVAGKSLRHDRAPARGVLPVSSGRVLWRLAAVAMTAIALANGVPALAQEASPTAPTVSEAPEPPYEAQFLRLSEILGSIHYLRRLCDSREGNLWRDQMQALINAESPSPIRRARLIDRFNRGYGSFRSVYRACTPAAVLAVERYMDEAAKITRDITTRYGR